MSGPDGETMDSFYKLFDSALADCKLTGYDETSFLGLEKHTDGIKDSKKRMSDM